MLALAHEKRAKHIAVVAYRSATIGGDVGVAQNFNCFSDFATEIGLTAVGRVRRLHE
jgi:hypothetical protein